jgi:hypothetical protein
MTGFSFVPIFGIFWKLGWSLRAVRKRKRKRRGRRRRRRRSKGRCSGAVFRRCICSQTFEILINAFKGCSCRFACGVRRRASHLGFVRRVGKRNRNRFHVSPPPPPPTSIPFTFLFYAFGNSPAPPSLSAASRHSPSTGRPAAPTPCASPPDIIIHIPTDIHSPLQDPVTLAALSVEPSPIAISESNVSRGAWRGVCRVSCDLSPSPSALDRNRCRQRQTFPPNHRS